MEVQGVAKRATQTPVRVTVVRVEIYRLEPARNKRGLQKIQGVRRHSTRMTSYYSTVVLVWIVWGDGKVE